MHRLLFIFSILSITLVFMITPAVSDQNYPSDDEWDFYLDAIDPYANGTKKKSTKKSGADKIRRSNAVLIPKPLPKGATPQQISAYNQKMQKALRAQQQIESDSLYETVESMGYKKVVKPAKEAPFSITTTNSIVNKGYSAKKVNFSWGGKLSGYDYEDYEFKFESTNTEHTNKMAKAASGMARSGWEVDLNRSFQEVEGTGDNAKAFTTTQMRFRRPK